MRWTEAHQEGKKRELQFPRFWVKVWKTFLVSLGPRRFCCCKVERDAELCSQFPASLIATLCNAFLSASRFLCVFLAYPYCTFGIAVGQSGMLGAVDRLFVLQEYQSVNPLSTNCRQVTREKQIKVPIKPEASKDKKIATKPLPVYLPASKARPQPFLSMIIRYSTAMIASGST